MVLYGVATVLFLPGSVLTLAGGEDLIEKGLIALALLARRGFADVHVVCGGMTAWLEHGWPTERGPQQLESSQ